MKPKHQRLILALLALGGLFGAGLIAASALRDEVSYFYTPTTLAKGKVEAGEAIRLGGMVKPQSIKHAPDGVSLTFVVQDQTSQQAVFYRGIPPDLFVEGSGVVADGRMRADGVFVADNLLAKHDENYIPRELADIDMKAAASTGKTLAQ